MTKKTTEKIRTIIIGDVHGCLEELSALLQKIGYKEDLDRLILAGDVVNKGPNSLGVLDWIAQNHSVEVIKGNHELKLLEAAKNPLTASKNMQILIGELGNKLDAYIKMIETWPMYIETADFLVVHAGVVPGEHPSTTSPDITANIRYWDGVGAKMNDPTFPAWYDLYLQEKLIIYGHWAIEGLNVRKNTIGLDSGCVYGNYLSAVVLPGRTIEQWEAKKVYCF